MRPINLNTIIVSFSPGKLLTPDQQNLYNAIVFKTKGAFTFFQLEAPTRDYIVQKKISSYVYVPMWKI